MRTLKIPLFTNYFLGIQEEDGKRLLKIYENFCMKQPGTWFDVDLKGFNLRYIYSISQSWIEPYAIETPITFITDLKIHVIVDKGKKPKFKLIFKNSNVPVEKEYEIKLYD